jgi:hypothetical protein
MSKRELIDAILQHNRTAAPEFLAQFTETDLKAYLDRMALITARQMQPRIQLAIEADEPLLVS